MHDSDRADTTPAPPEPAEPAEPEHGGTGGFRVFADVYRARWATSAQPAGRRSPTSAAAQSSAAANAAMPVRPLAEDGTRLIRAGDERPTSRTTSSGDFVVADGLTLDRLYARFDGMAEGLTKGDSTTAHRSIIERLAANRRRAEAQGWTGFVLQRRGGSGRLELLGSPGPGSDRVVVPDQIPYAHP